MAFLSANDGGCWFCNTDDGPMADGDWYFSDDWDAFFHGECCRKALRKDPKNQEALLMAEQHKLTV